jgi:hypothetical protein
MADDRLTDAELGVLMTLMAEARGLTNRELNDLGSPSLDGGRRKKLNELKLVESRKDGRAYVHDLTKRGWARCGEEISGARKKGARKGGGAIAAALFAVLAGVGRHLERNGLKLDDVFRAEGAPAGPEPVASGASAASSTPATPAVPPSEAEIEARIRGAYKQLAGRPGGWVSLTALRPLLGDVEKADVDAVLRRMDRDRRVNVVPEDDQSILTAEDRAAAVKIGGQDNHILAIEDA